ncbi:MAG: hypothetical protein RLZZ244_1543 [Verrucomicrobiota bacterium]
MDRPLRSAPPFRLPPPKALLLAPLLLPPAALPQEPPPAPLHEEAVFSVRPFATEIRDQEAGWSGGLLKPSTPLLGEAVGPLSAQQPLPPEEELLLAETSLTQAIRETVPTLFSQSRDTPLPIPSPEADGLRFRVGAIELRPLLSASIRSDDNLFQVHTRPVADTVSTLTPGLLGGFGDIVTREDTYLGFGYAPSLLFHARHRELNTTNQFLRFEGQRTLPSLTWGGAWQWANLTENSRDLGRRIQLEVHLLEAKARYLVGERSKLEAEASFSNADYRAIFQSNELSTKLWALYALSPKLDAGLGLGAGSLEPSNGLQTTFEQIHVRARLASTEKLQFDAGLGLDFRHTSHASFTRLTPLLQLEARWNPREGTILGLSSRNKIQSSGLRTNLHYEYTRVSLDCQQRVLSNLRIDSSLGWEHFTYFSSAPSARPDPENSRRDDSAFVRIALSLLLQNRSSLSLFTLYRRNHSNLPELEFQNHQLGVECKTTF